MKNNEIVYEEIFDVLRSMSVEFPEINEKSKEYAEKAWKLYNSDTIKQFDGNLVKNKRLGDPSMLVRAMAYSLASGDPDSVEMVRDSMTQEPNFFNSSEVETLDTAIERMRKSEKRPGHF